jgi:DNA-directed RNA polymerase specialized sigma subunit
VRRELKETALVNIHDRLNLTQREIGRRLRCSEMHVSPRLCQAVTRLQDAA